MALFWYKMTEPFCELQSQATIDDAQGNDNATEPDVGVGPNDTPAVPLERKVVYETQEGLEEEEKQTNDANDRMCIMHYTQARRHPDADCGRPHEDHERENLE